MLSVKKVAGSVIVAVAAVVGFTGNSYAWGGHDHHDHHRHYYRYERPYYHAYPYFGLHVRALPRDSFSISIGGSRYFYSSGYYYFRDRDDYVVVNPPLGAITTTIPVGYTPVVINGVTYYTNNGVYYLYTPTGYQVVPQPTTILQTMPVSQIVTPSVPSGSLSAVGDSFNVNIPNDNGGFTLVVIKKAERGYTGPQGEFYAEFPKVAQLKEMYGK